MLLALETATNICSVAFKNPQDEVYEKRSETHASHSENLFLFIKELMTDHSFSVSDLEAVLVSEGPGSYTGLRISAGGVKGLLFGTGVPLFGVNTLASFAFAAIKKHPNAIKIHSIIDARRKHFYHQSFIVKNPTVSTENKLKIRTINEFEQLIQPSEVISGTGLERMNETVRKKVQLMEESYISARSLIRLVKAKNTGSFYRKVDPAAFSPKYYQRKNQQG